MSCSVRNIGFSNAAQESKVEKRIRTWQPKQQQHRRRRWHLSLYSVLTFKVLLWTLNKHRWCVICSKVLKMKVSGHLHQSHSNLLEDALYYSERRKNTLESTTRIPFQTVLNLFSCSNEWTGWMFPVTSWLLKDAWLSTLRRTSGRVLEVLTQVESNDAKESDLWFYGSPWDCIRNAWEIHGITWSHHPSHLSHLSHLSHFSGQGMSQWVPSNNPACRRMCFQTWSVG